MEQDPQLKQDAEEGKRRKKGRHRAGPQKGPAYDGKAPPSYSRRGIGFILGSRTGQSYQQLETKVREITSRPGGCR